MKCNNEKIYEILEKLFKVFSTRDIMKDMIRLHRGSSIVLIFERQPYSKKRREAITDLNTA